jgi:hypothetical protein
LYSNASVWLDSRDAIALEPSDAEHTDAMQSLHSAQRTLEYRHAV